jgi:DNA-binding transcriptional MerR regulator
MRVSQLAESLGVNPDTVRYYTRIGLLDPKKSFENGYKTYGPKEVSRLRFILSARHLGFSVEDITRIFCEADAGKSACHTVRGLIDSRLNEIEQRLNDTIRLRDRMLAAIDKWNDMPDMAPNGNEVCHLIEEFEDTSK